jgi:hypothetical protein
VTIANCRLIDIGKSPSSSIFEIGDHNHRRRRAFRGLLRTPGREQVIDASLSVVMNLPEPQQEQC